MSQHFTPVSSGARLSDQVAEQLAAACRGLLPGMHRLVLAGERREALHALDFQTARIVCSTQTSI